MFRTADLLKKGQLRLETVRSALPWSQPCHGDLLILVIALESRGSIS